MLFTDADIQTADALLAIDSEVPRVAQAENLLLAGPGQNSICRQAMTECAHWITAEMQSHGGVATGLGISGGHTAAVLDIGGAPSAVPYCRLSNVVASGNYDNMQSNIERWVIYKTLALFYRAATNRKVNDRYEGKYRQYKADADNAESYLKSSGLPIVMSPLPCPGSAMEPDSGAWDATCVSLVSGSGTSTDNYQIAITYLDSSLYVSPTDKGNAESGPSARIERVAESGKVFRLSISTLNPPTGSTPKRGTAEGSVSYLTATHWNVYVGKVGGRMFLQNGLPIPIGTTTYTLSGDPALTGDLLGLGQYPDSNFAFITGGGRRFRG